MKQWIRLGGNSLPFFYETCSGSDRRSVVRQMRERKFEASLVLGTAKRCRFGVPQVIVCSPLYRILPFPTSFWLTCPWLVRHLARLESEGGVGRLEHWMRHCPPATWIGYNMDHQKLRLGLLSAAQSVFLRAFRPQFFGRLRSGGIGGIRYGPEIRVKCLHLQAASWLALGRHPAAVWLEAHGVKGDCGGELCGGSGD